MVKSPTRLPIKLLLNAEPFGFGPTAAIADFFPYLRKHFVWIGFAGSGHSLDLQRFFDYDEFIDLTGREGAAFDEIVKNYDLFFTAVDFDMAERAACLGIPTVIYDPLTWFWKEIPSVVAKKEVLYLAQGFHGVNERLKQSEKFGQAAIVPPLVKRMKRDSAPQRLLLNMGGLMNPHWNLSTCCEYALAMIEAVRSAVPFSANLEILSSAQVAGKVSGIGTLSREEVAALLPKVKMAFQTPGLANIYDSAAFGLPTLFLPPANDSQGQQLDLLRKHGQIDGYVDWEDLPGGEKIDYRAKSENVMSAISNQVERLKQPEMREALSELIKERLPRNSALRLPAILKQYGEAGAGMVADLVIEKAKEVMSYV